MTTFPCPQDFISCLPVSSLAVTTAMDVHFLRCARVSQFKSGGVEEEGMSGGIWCSEILDISSIWLDHSSSAIYFSARYPDFWLVVIIPNTFTSIGGANLYTIRQPPVPQNTLVPCGREMSTSSSALVLTSPSRESESFLFPVFHVPVYPMGFLCYCFHLPGVFRVALCHLCFCERFYSVMGGRPSSTHSLSILKPITITPDLSMR